MGADGIWQTERTAQIDRAANRLACSSPYLSARGGLTTWQRRVLLMSGIGGIVLAIWAPAVLYWMAIVLFASLIVWRAFLVSYVLLLPPEYYSPDLNDSELPAYSILVALYDEARSVADLVTALKQLNYPSEKLDIHFLLEASDADTLNALRHLVLPDNLHVHVLLPGHPQTKPRALNFGLEFAKGDIVTIYDAEDRPHPDQLRGAAAVFAKAGTRMACVQAPLIAHNASESWIASQWALEYDIQFGLLVPALSQAGLPIPLGGTSNHFSRNLLEFSGGWDAWNVTEDADLGLRFARLGFEVGVIGLPTWEEAPETLSVWAAQRSRWIKGYIQTWMVHMREPIKGFRELGAAHSIAIQMMLGGAVLSAILAGPMAIWLLACLFISGTNIGMIGSALLACGIAVNVFAALAAPGKRTLRRSFSVISLPLYWPLLSLGAARALYGLMRSPHFWAKTPHGLTAARLQEGPSTCSPSTGS